MRIVRNVFLTGFVVASCIWPAFAQDKLSGKEAQARAFLTKHADPEKTLKREREFHQELLQRNLKSIKAQAKQFESEFTRFMDFAEEVEGRSPEVVVSAGPCHYASFALHAAMVQVARQGLPRKLPEKVDEVVPLQTREQFAENMRRCELLRRLPRSDRLIGSGLL